ncbi:hypothetical protein GWK47_046747 [Chionoecetes opilio]|uniref:Uncharacterized protein n=1 Tax=Chionoecetes opilio TaxID=41210 RepID=A0A8J4YBT5_CHIOP|nr:hypothetical protein GWK47_046747 [Chionoecetes opilio]
MPYIPHEDPEAIDNLRRPEDRLVPSWTEASIGCEGETYPFEERSPRGLPQCATCPSLSHLTGNLRQPIKKPGASTTPVDGKGIYVLRSACSVPRANDNTEGRDLNRSLLFRRSPLLAACGWRRGLAPKLALQRLNTRRRNLHHFQEINGSIGKIRTLHHILPRTLVPRRPISCGCLFSREDHMRRRKKMAE